MMNTPGLQWSKGGMTRRLVILVVVYVAMTVSPSQAAPVPEDDPLLNDLTSSSGDTVDTGPTMSLGSEHVVLEEAEYQVVNNAKTTALVYRTMTPETKRFTTASTTLPPIPPTTTHPTIPPRTTMRVADIHVVKLDTTLKPLVNEGDEPSSTKSLETPSSTVSFTTAPVKVEEVHVEASTTTTTPTPTTTPTTTPSTTTLEPTTPSTAPSSTTEEDGPILVGVGESDSHSSPSSPSPSAIPRSKATVKLTDNPTPTTTSATTTTKTTTEGDDGAILVEVESEVTEKVVLAPSTTLSSTVKGSTESDGILVDVVVENESKSSTLPEPTSTVITTVPTTTTTTVPVKSSTEAPELPPTEKVTKTTSTIEHTIKVEILDPVESKSTTKEESTSTLSTTTKAEKTTEDEGILVVPVDKIDVGDENKLKKNESMKAPPSTKLDSESSVSTEATTPLVLKSGPGKYGVMSDLKTDPPPTPSEEDTNVNATHIGESKEGGLSYAARTGIAMGCIVGFWIIIGPLVCLICKLRDKKRDKREKEERNAREKANSSLVEEMVKAELQKTPNGEKKKMYNDDKLDDGEIEPITIGDSDSLPYIDADANSRDTAL